MTTNEIARKSVTLNNPLAPGVFRRAPHSSFRPWSPAATDYPRGDVWQCPLSNRIKAWSRGEVGLDHIVHQLQTLCQYITPQPLKPTHKHNPKAPHSATVSKGVHCLKSALGIPFLFMGVFRVTLWIYIRYRSRSVTVPMAASGIHTATSTYGRMDSTDASCGSPLFA